MVGEKAIELEITRVVVGYFNKLHFNWSFADCNTCKRIEKLLLLSFQITMSLKNVRTHCACSRCQKGFASNHHHHRLLKSNLLLT